jgi:hypothetical protein
VGLPVDYLGYDIKFDSKVYVLTINVEKWRFDLNYNPLSIFPTVFKAPSTLTILKSPSFRKSPMLGKSKFGGVGKHAPVAKAFAILDVLPAIGRAAEVNSYGPCY